MRHFYFAFLLLLTSTVQAAAPKAIINGPTTGVPGELLVLDASQSIEATHFLWRVTPDLPGRKLLDPSPDGKTCRIASLPGTYTYTLVVSNAEGADLLFWTVSIVGAPPSPGPGPSPVPPVPPTPGPGPEPVPVPPGPTPPPDLPVGQFGISRDVRNWAQAVQSDQRAQQAAALADAADSTSAAVAAGTISGPAAVLKAMLAANQQALGPHITLWKTFGDQYAARLRDLYTAGKIATDADWSALLRETALGLRAVK